MLAGLRVLVNNRTTDLDEARALGWQNDEIDIYSCSWGPEERTIFGPGNLTQKTLQMGAKEVRWLCCCV